MKTVKLRKLSRAGRARQAESGRRNLLAWHERARAASENVNAETEEFRVQLFGELGANPSATRKALALSALSNYTAILLVNKELAKKRQPNVLALTERCSWLTGALVRTLQRLALDTKPRPRTLADLAARSEAEKVQTGPLKSTLSSQKSNGEVVADVQ